ncbi:hypothetical protein BDF19DRAFT_496769 [Syncephalis fuscata]|nr:hypothetical protein BDF19DRAFT_496769 [Syncephalis fuscata]
MYKITIKVYHGKIGRRFSDYPTEFTWDKLEARICTLFSLNRPLYGLIYKDSDGDHIFMNSNEELKMLFEPFIYGSAEPTTICFQVVPTDTALYEDTWLIEGNQATEYNADTNPTANELTNEEEMHGISDTEPLLATPNNMPADLPANYQAGSVLQPIQNPSNTRSIPSEPFVTTHAAVNNATTTPTTPATPTTAATTAAATTEFSSEPTQATENTAQSATPGEAALPPLTSQIANLARQFVETLRSNPELNENAHQVLNRSVSAVEQSFTRVVECLQTEFTQIYNSASNAMTSSRRRASPALPPRNTAPTYYPHCGHHHTARTSPENHATYHAASSAEFPDTVWVDRSSEEQAARITRQIAELREMGFYDEALCRRALEQHSNLSSAIDELLRTSNAPINT